MLDPVKPEALPKHKRFLFSWGLLCVVVWLATMLTTLQVSLIRQKLDALPTTNDFGWIQTLIRKQKKRFGEGLSVVTGILSKASASKTICEL